MTGQPASPLDRLTTLPEGTPRLTLGWEVVGWATRYLIHPNGSRAGQRWQFVESQVRFLLWWYAVNDAGEWLFHHAARRLAKGSGKSPFAGLLSLAELTAPVRLKDFDPRRPGGCVGKPVDMPWVQIVATAESQTKNTMRMVRALAKKGSRLAVAYDLDPGKTQYYKGTDGLLEVITSSFTAAEGAEGTFAVEDETEHWKPANGGVDLASTVDDNLTKSGNRSIETSNSWLPGTESVAEATYNAWIAQEEGRSRNESKILYDARMAPPDTRLDDEESLTKGLAFVYGDCFWADQKAIRTKIWDLKSKPDDSKRKYLNWPTAAEDSWTTLQLWSQLADTSKVVADQEDIAAFFDGSKSRDATALMGCRISDGHVFTLGVWEPKPDHQVPVDQVDAAVEQMFDRYNVLGFFADVREFEGYVHTTWPQRYADRLAIKAVPGGKEPASIAWDMRSHTYEFTKACELTEFEIREKAFTHDGDSRVTRHVVNTKAKPNRYGTSVGKESPDSPNKIDANVCVIGARMVRRLVIAAAPKKKRTGGVW